MRVEQNIIPRKNADGEWVFEVLGVPFGGHLAGKDAQGEYFTERTDVMLDIGDERPVLYYHGMLPSGEPDPNPHPIGRARVTRKDKDGWWFDVIIDKTKKFASRLWESAVMGLARASGGSVGHLVRKNESTGELYVWPLAELTLLDKGQGRAPANELATVNLKSVYEEAEMELPEDFVEAEEVEAESVNEVEAAQEPGQKDNSLKVGGITIKP